MASSALSGNVSAIGVVSVTFNPASVAAAKTAEQDITVPGIRTTDVILSVTKPTLSAGLGIANARVKAANTVAVTFINATASAIDAGSEVYNITYARMDTLSPLTAAIG